MQDYERRTSTVFTPAKAAAELEEGRRTPVTFAHFERSSSGTSLSGLGSVFSSSTAAAAAVSVNATAAAAAATAGATAGGSKSSAGSTCTTPAASISPKRKQHRGSISEGAKGKVRTTYQVQLLALVHFRLFVCCSLHCDRSLQANLQRRCAVCVIIYASLKQFCFLVITSLHLRVD
eukprot:8811-Heterococcus_DN1.PRE.1